MPRSRTPHLSAPRRRASAVHVRNILDDLSPTMKALALEMAGPRGAAAVEVTNGGRGFTIIDPVKVPDGSGARA